MITLFVTQLCFSKSNPQITSELRSKVEMLKQAEPNSNAYKLAFEIENNLLSNDNTYSLTDKEKESLSFLYAYMSLNDMAENTFAFFANITKQAYITKTLPWGNTVPNDIFKHYVLPPRVNNEALDNAREVFYGELHDRVKNLSMYEAVVEVNHWCKEKVVYKPTDGRTTQPLNVIERAYGRCGEESTVAVVALRSVGIPARQVYVPRWVHTNSNHAWVEAWVDGEWYYLGACEPEPILNRGWFTESASRTMMVHSFTYGMIDDENFPKDEIISKDNLYTQINNTETYAPVKKAIVKVVDKNGLPIKGASVSFNIINSDWVTSIADKTTDQNGEASLITGLGTFMIEAYHNDKQIHYAIREYNLSKDDSLLIVLDNDERLLNDKSVTKIDDYILTPPAATRFPKELTNDEIADHNIRCAIDDSIRLSHTATFRFANEADAEVVSKEMVNRGLSKNMESGLTTILAESLSGGYEIEKFLNGVSPQNLDLAVKLLNVIRAKDRHELTKDIYDDYLSGVLRLGSEYKDNEVFTYYVLNPRFSNEAPIAFKTALWQILSDNGMSSPADKQSAIKAVTNVLNKVQLVDTERYNPRHFDMTPISIAQFGVADLANYKVYARALLNTAGIPNRLNNISSEIEIYLNDEWQDFVLNNITTSDAEATPIKTTVITINDPVGVKNSRRYTLQQWKDNQFQDVRLSDDFSRNRKRTESQTITVEEGIYRIVTSIRAADGSLLTRITSFEAKEGVHKTIDVEWHPVKEDEVVVIGTMDVEWRFTPKSDNDSEEISILDAVGRNFFVLAYLEPTKEPSQHFIRELSNVSENIKIPTLILLNDKDNMDFFFKQDYKLKDGIHYGYDTHDVIIPGLSNSLKETDLNARLPVVIVADSFGNIYYKSVGYSIGIPTDIINLKLPSNIDKD